MVLYNEMFVYFGHRLHTVHANEVVNHSTQNKERKGNGVALWFQTPPHPISLTGSSNCLDIYGMQESNDEADG